MNAPGPGHGRRISSLSVTYQEEFHKPGPAEVPTANPSVANAPPSSSSTGVYASQGLGPGDQALNDICEEFQGVNDFEGLSTPVSLYPSLQTNCLHSMQPQCTDPAIAQFPVPPPSVPCWPAGNPLYALEDSLRQKINIQIENFRASVQQTFCEQFTNALHTLPVTANGCTMPYRPPPCSNNREAHVVPSEEVLSGEVPSEEVPSEEGSEMTKENLDSCAIRFQNFGSQEDSVYSSDASMSTGTVDSGGGDPPKPPLDQELDQCLIRLQTLAAVITNTLRRTEYSSL